MKRVTVFKAMLNGKCKALHLEKKPLQEYIEKQLSFLGKDELNATDWKLVSEFEDVYEQTGKRIRWNDSSGGRPLIHVHWQCPYCRHEQTTDIDDDENSTQLWMCGQPSCPSDVLTLVNWTKELQEEAE